MRDVGHVDQRKVGHALGQLAKARLHEFLALLRHVIFGVFAEVAQRHGRLNLFWELVSELVLQQIDLFLELLLDVFRHVLVHYTASPKRTCGFRRKYRRGRKVGQGRSPDRRLAWPSNNLAINNLEA